MRHALVALGGVGGKPPLYCVHPIGGHVGEYVRLAEQLDRPVVGIPSRGIHDARDEHASITSMIADYADAIAESPGPYCVFGWSLGGLIAHSVACHLERRGAPVALVGMVDPPPAMPVPAADERPIAISMALAIFHPSPPPRPIQRRAMQSLPGDPGSLAAWCVANELLPADAPLADIDAAIELFGIHRAMFAGHVAGICAAPLHVWNARSLADHDWSRHTTGACVVKAVGGDHFTIMKSPHVDAIAADLRAIA